MDSITATIERANLRAHVQHVGNAAERHTKAEALVTANRVVADARARLRRQLRKPTGATEAGIIAREGETFVGYVVMSIRRDAREMYNLPIWIEGGTKRGKPRSHDEPARPYFFPAVKAQASDHVRRIEEAIGDAIVEAMGQ